MAQLAIVNGRVWGRPGLTAVALEGERIAAVGRDREMGAAERVLDAAGCTILPAFNDAHVHFLMGSRTLGRLDLFGAGTLDEIEREILRHARATPGEWVLGRGWLYSAFPGGMPSVDLLDRLVPDRPAYLESFDAHTGWANRRALALAGVSEAAVLKEEDAMRLVTRHIPPPSRTDDLKALREGMRLAASRGIAGVQEAGDGQEQLDLWRALRDEGRLTIRVRLGFDMIPGLEMDEWARRLDSYEALRLDGDAWLSTGILKAFADGVVESRTAALIEPYAGSSERGLPIWGAGELREAVRMADARGWQVQVHAIGDAAIAQALDAFEGTAPGRRHRVEHIECPRPLDLARFAELGVVASMQPQHSDPRITEAWRLNLGPERAARGWPWRELANAGARLAFGTDWPVVPLDPFGSIAAAQSIGRDAAIDAWTSGSAYAEHAEHVKGRVEPGYLADLAVVDLDAGVVRATLAGGRIVYEG